MGSKWFQNMAGATLDDEAMKEIPHPRLELTIHVTAKTIQAGAVIGMLMVAPIACAIKKENHNMMMLTQKMTRAGRNGMIIGAGLGPLFTLMKVKGETDPYKNWDRCYRLRYSRCQVRVDQLSIVGAVGGAAIGAAAGSGALFGGMLGMCSGVLLAAIYNNV